jgi:hypothetical protein
VNDRDVEKLIARLDRPSPSQELDARIVALTRLARPERNNSPTRRVLGLSSTVACAGLLGFALGRLSASTQVAAPAVPGGETGITASTVLERPAAAVRVDAPASEALVRFVSKPVQFVSVFGNGPLAEQKGPTGNPNDGRGL